MLTPSEKGGEEREEEGRKHSFSSFLSFFLLLFLF